MPDLNFYLNSISRLNVNRNHGIPAPHKPLLLLAVIDLIEQGKVADNKIRPSTEFVEAFLKYWNLIRSERPRIFLPFYHLQTDGFWHLHPTPHGTIRPFGSMTQTAENVSFASLDEKLFILLAAPKTREIIRHKIILTYFPNEKEIFHAAVSENRADFPLKKLLLEPDAGRPETSPDKPKRSRLFRGLIMRLYNYTCAACRFRLVTLDGMTAVDAAHIVPFSVSRDNAIDNGLALCKLHHWAFDNGLIAIDDDFRLQISEIFDERGDEAFLFRRLHSKKIHLPAQAEDFPSLDKIRRHRLKFEPVR
ncbi:MAG: HNH endonuclease [Acidobacteria bacterium]|nr:HNH endonuclease [Acidobacteriota bacterium]